MPLTLIFLNPFPSILPPRCAAQPLSSLPLLRSNNNNHTHSFLCSPRKKETKRKRDLRGKEATLLPLLPIRAVRVVPSTEPESRRVTERRRRSGREEEHRGSSSSQASRILPPRSAPRRRATDLPPIQSSTPSSLPRVQRRRCYLCTRRGRG
ncbi:uncharacterized protein DS421_13g412200 [Arachis hypogaea]|nr:uncharacterized protein DS421_13g412200 [Arachis hypogaea]